MSARHMAGFLMVIAYRTFVRYNKSMKKNRRETLSGSAAKIQAFYERHRRMPSYAEAAKIFEYKSKDSAFRLMQKLIASGAIDRDTKGKLLPTGKKSAGADTGLRLLGLVEAGFPTPAEETDLDRITLDEWIIGDRAASFMLKVKGDSMQDAGIHAGDYVVVERTDKARVGSIVIAEVDGAWTMKYLRKDGKGFYLEPANKHFKIIRPNDALAISAIVKAVVRKYD